MLFRRLGALIVVACLLWPVGALAQAPAPSTAGESLRAALVQSQLLFERDPQAAQAAFASARTLYASDLRPSLEQYAAADLAPIDSAFASAEDALKANSPARFAAARSRIWTGLLQASYHTVTGALQAHDVATARAWLPLREFRQATRFARPNADATLALDQLAAGAIDTDTALQAINADLLDTYQARLSAALEQIASADAASFSARRAEAGGEAAGYFTILSAAYAEQRGSTASASAQSAFEQLQQASISGEQLPTALAQVQAQLDGFRAAPLSPSEQTRRAGQLLRYLNLVPIEYGRGVKNNQVTSDLEIQEAVTFFHGATAAFADLQPLLSERDAQATAALVEQFATLNGYLQTASDHGAVVDADTLTSHTNTLMENLKALMPADWQKTNLDGDFDVIHTLLDQVVQAAAAGDYERAESARLEGYAVLESGPEARLIVFAPQFKAPLEDLFWYGQGEQPGLARLIRDHAPLADIKASKAALDDTLKQAQRALGGSNNAPAAVATNAAIIVFREGLEAVLILASLLASLKLGEQRRLRRPIWIGAVGALAASVLTWMLARGILQSLARYGERLEAIVSLIAIGVLLLITNWFFHKVYWTGWMANFHARKRRLIGGQAGLWLGLIALGFTSIYREGFETVLFLQALVLEAGTSVVLSGVALGLGGTLLVGVLVFGLQARLPHKKMLIVTGVMIGAVLLIMVGNTVHVLQVVGWFPLHPIRSLSLPYWAGMWLGLFATWEGIIAQIAAGTFVIGSYYLAEHLQHRRTREAMQKTQQPVQAKA